jgi:hypothetical protein
MGQGGTRCEKLRPVAAVARDRRLRMDRLRDLEESAVGAARADADMDRPGAFWAMARVCGLSPVDVNPCVDVTTGKMHANEATPCDRRIERLLRRLTAEIEVFAGHCPRPILVEG